MLLKRTNTLDRQENSLGNKLSDNYGFSKALVEIKMEGNPPGASESEAKKKSGNLRWEDE